MHRNLKLVLAFCLPVDNLPCVGIGLPGILHEIYRSSRFFEGMPGASLLCRFVWRRLSTMKVSRCWSRNGTGSASSSTARSSLSWGDWEVEKQSWCWGSVFQYLAEMKEKVHTSDLRLRTRGTYVRDREVECSCLEGWMSWSRSLSYVGRVCGRLYRCGWTAWICNVFGWVASVV